MAFDFSQGKSVTTGRRGSKEETMKVVLEESHSHRKERLTSQPPLFFKL